MKPFSVKKQYFSGMPGLSIFLLLLLIISPLSLLAGDTLSTSTAFQISPQEIQIGTFYHGGRLRVDFSYLNNDAFIIKLEGARESIKLSKKGRVFFLWMTVGEIVFHNTPQVYLIYSSQKLTELAAAPELSQFGLGYSALGNQIEVEGSGQERETVLNEFVRLKEKEKLFGIHHNGPFPEEKQAHGLRHVSFNLDIPSTIPAGQYSMKLYLVREGKITETASDTLTMRKTGLVSIITDLAYNRAKLYGAFSVIAAIVIGVLIGLLFAFLKRK